MKKTTILGSIVETLGALTRGKGKADSKLGALDRGILEVALMIAALDGEILPDEFAAFDALARKCRGYSATSLRLCIDRALQKAGYLLAMAQVGVYSDDERIDAFIDRAEDAMPMGFAVGARVDVRRAFALWVAMGVSDGTFSRLERRAVEALLKHFSLVRHARDLAATQSMVEPFVGLQPVCCPTVDVTPRALLEADYLDEAEKIVRALALPAKRAAAESALEALVNA